LAIWKFCLLLQEPGVNSLLLVLSNDPEDAFPEVGFVICKSHLSPVLVPVRVSLTFRVCAGVRDWLQWSWSLSPKASQIIDQPSRPPPQRHRRFRLFVPAPGGLFFHQMLVSLLQSRSLLSSFVQLFQPFSEYVMSAYGEESRPIEEEKGHSF
jgi:hypothetical protein